MGSGTQYTVNNQMVNATLMNIADNPTNVQLPGVYKNVRGPRPAGYTSTSNCFIPTKELAPAGLLRACACNRIKKSGSSHTW